MKASMITQQLAVTILLVATGGCSPKAGHAASLRRTDCDTIDYEARSLSATLQIPNGVSAGVDTSKKALRDVDRWVEKYFAAWKTACMDYKNGALTREEYRDETGRIRRAMERFEELSLRLESARDPAVFEATLRETWTALAPETERVDLGLELVVMAKRPGEAQFRVAPPGATLPSGSKLYAEVALTQSANVSLYQVDALGRRNVLFPSSAIAIGNPLPAGQSLRIPPNGVFELDDHDLGIEDLHVVASPDASAAAPPERVAQGAQTCNGRGLQFVADECPRPRGLVLAAEEGEVSVKAVNAPADNGVHLVYSFHHVGEAKTYGRKCPEGEANCRGLEPLKSVVAQRPPQMPGTFEQCPASAAVKEMPGPQGSYERWCVEERSDGQLVDHGPYRKWYASGVLWVTGQMDMGRRIGTWSTFDPDGNRLAEVPY